MGAVGENACVPLWMPSPEVHSLESLVFCTAQLTQQSTREAFSCIHFSHPVICSDLRETVHGICQSSRNNVSGGLLLELLSNLRWQQSIRIALVSVKEKKTRGSLPV